MDRERLEQDVREALSDYPDKLEYSFDLWLDLKTKEQAITHLLSLASELKCLLGLFQDGEMALLVMKYLDGE
jgi:hypothetical protein